jgi:MFS superfamily sulfate permease-like transporter
MPSLALNRLFAVVADGVAGTRHDSNQELIGQGAAHIA